MSTARILVVDDESDIRSLLDEILTEEGYEVAVAGNASEARQILSGIMFDLLIIDIMKPGETGLEFLQELRKKDNVPALFLTAMSETEHRIEGLETGADDYMSSRLNRANLCYGLNVFYNARQASVTSPKRWSILGLLRLIRPQAH